MERNLRCSPDKVPEHVRCRLIVIPKAKVAGFPTSYYEQSCVLGNHIRRALQVSLHLTKSHLILLMATVVNPVYLLSIQKVVLFGFVCEGLRQRFQGNSNVSAVESILFRMWIEVVTLNGNNEPLELRAQVELKVFEK